MAKTNGNKLRFGKMKPQFHKCSGCNNQMVKNSREYFCPKCGLTEEMYDGI